MPRRNFTRSPSTFSNPPGAARSTVTGGVAVQALPKTRRKRTVRSESVRIVRADDTPPKPVITDRLTARVLGLLLLILPLIIDSSYFVLAAPGSRSPAFPFLVILPSLPLFAIGVYLLWRAEHLKEK